MLRVQYASDIHLEHYKIAFEHDLNPKQFLNPDTSADVLVLAGDIGYPEEATYSYFLRWCSKSWKQVVIVAGNHEFYNVRGTGAAKLSVAEKKAAIRAAIAEFSNVHYLDREKLEITPGVWILGCTLWTDVPKDMMYDAISCMNDYRLIDTTFQALIDWHKEDVAWLDKELAEIDAAGQKAVVVTHHMPSFKAIARKFRGHPLNVCFATDLNDLITRGKPVAWFCGHSHEGGEYTVGSTKIYMNPRGYPFEKVSTREPRKLVDLVIA